MKNKEKAVVPKLRFQEFVNCSIWECDKIGNIGKFYYGKSAPKWSLSANAPTQCVRYGELYTKFDTVITRTYSKTTIDPKNLRFSKGGEILIPRVGEKPDDFGRCCCYLPLKNIAIGEMISVFETSQNPVFYTYYFRHLYTLFATVVEGQNVKNLYYTELEPLKIFRPSIPEQQKIADCLTSLDELITAESKKLEFLQDHKRGLIQKLFPTEGKTMPEWRFPEFKDSGEWKYNLITTISKTSIGLVTTMTKHYVDEGIKLIRNSDIAQNQIKKTNLINLDISFAEVNKNKKLQKYDIVTVHTGDIGTSCVIEKDMIGSIGFATLNTRPNLKLIDPYYLCWYFNSPVNIRYAINMATGDGRSNYNLKDFDNAKIPVPPTLCEQKKIADCLSSVDILISEQSNKIEQLKEHKKGLMQGLFPSVEEVE